MKSEVELNQEARRGRRRRNFPLLISFPEFQSRKKGNKKSYNIFLVLFYFRGKLGFRPKFNLPSFCSFLAEGIFPVCWLGSFCCVVKEDRCKNTTFVFTAKKVADLSSFLLRSERKKCSRETGRIEGKGKRGNPSSSPFFPFSPIPFGLEGKGKRDVAVCQFAKKPLLLGEEEKGIYWSVSETEKSTIAGYFLQLGKSRYFFSPSFPTKKTLTSNKREIFEFRLSEAAAAKHREGENFFVWKYASSAGCRGREGKGGKLLNSFTSLGFMGNCRWKKPISRRLI